MAPSTVVVTIEKPNNLSVVQINAVSDDGSPLLPADKQKAASTKLFTFTVLLKIYRALTCISWLAGGFNSLFRSIKKWMSQSGGTGDEVEEQDMEPRSRGKLYNFIKAFLTLSVGALVVDVVAHYNKWNLNLVPPPWEVQGLVQWSYMAWLSFRLDYIAPTVKMLSQFCIVLFLIQSLDRLVLCLGCFWIKFKKLKPQINGDEYDVDDPCSFPMVLVQVPMCNEREVYATSIGAACLLDWPRDRLLIQVLDDSDDPNLQLIINEEVHSWRKIGVR